MSEFSNKNPNMILCSEPFVKSEFLDDLINSINLPVIFLDFDLLYSGYIISEMLQNNERVKIYRPQKHNLEKIFSEVIKNISERRCLVILDSFNGFFNLFDEIESGIFINAITILLGTLARQNNSMILVSAMVRKKEENGWVLTPGGRHFIETKNSGIYYVKSNENALTISLLDKKSEKIFQITNK